MLNVPPVVQIKDDEINNGNGTADWSPIRSLII